MLLITPVFLLLWQVKNVKKASQPYETVVLTSCLAWMCLTLWVWQLLCNSLNSWLFLHTTAGIVIINEKRWRILQESGSVVDRPQEGSAVQSYEWSTSVLVCEIFVRAVYSQFKQRSFILRPPAHWLRGVSMAFLLCVSCVAAAWRFDIQTSKCHLLNVFVSKWHINIF